jgi:glucose dehydrogenase
VKPASLYWCWQLRAPNWGSITAFDGHSGQVLWRICDTYSGDAALSGGTVLLSAAMADPFWAGLIAIDALSGTIRWKMSWNDNPDQVVTSPGFVVGETVCGLVEACA